MQLRYNNNKRNIKMETETIKRAISYGNTIGVFDYKIKRQPVKLKKIG